MEDYRNIKKTMEDNKQPLKFSNMKPLEVIEPYNPQIVEFDTVDDFNVYYNKHLDEFTGKTTQKLNTKYKIPGYKLTCKQGQLKLIKDYRGASNVKADNSAVDMNVVSSLLSRVNIIEKQIKEITDYLTASTRQ